MIDIELVEVCVICEKEFVAEVGPDNTISCMCEECIEEKPITTLKNFHIQFKKFLYRDDVWALLEETNCGWLDGGCRSLMKALTLWLGKENVVHYQIVKHPTEKHSEHGLIKVGDFFVDGDGVSTYKELYHRWLTEELVGKRYGVIYIQEFDPDTEPIHEPTGDKPFYIAEENIISLSTKLEETFDKELVLSMLRRD